MSEGKKLQDALTENCDFHMPRDYGEFGAPLYWRDDITGVMADAIDTLVALDEPPITAAQFVLLQEYIVHWINAPGWMWGIDWPSRAEFCQRIEQATTRDDLRAVLHDLIEYGIDPI